MAYRGLLLLLCLSAAIAVEVVHDFSGTITYDTTAPGAPPSATPFPGTTPLISSLDLVQIHFLILCPQTSLADWLQLHRVQLTAKLVHDASSCSQTSQIVIASLHKNSQSNTREGGWGLSERRSQRKIPGRNEWNWL